MPPKEETQMELIEDLHGPEFKALRKVLSDYDSHATEQKAQIKELHETEGDLRAKVLAQAVKAGLKPNSEGNYVFKHDGKVTTIEQKSQLKITTKRAPKEEPAPSAEPEGKEPPSEGRGSRR